MPKLTKTVVDKLQPRARRYEVADEALPGFYVRVNRGGSKTALIRYFIDGRQGAYTIGRLGDHFTLAQARAEARRMLGEVARGKDPARERKRRRTACTFAELAERFMDEHVRPYRKPRTAAGYAATLRLHLLPALGSMRVEEIERSDVERLHQRVGKESPYAANRLLALLSVMMNKAEGWGYRPMQSNPCYKLPKFREHKRKRILSGEERARLDEALEHAAADGLMSAGAIVAIRLLILTGARGGEITGLQWSMVDLGRSRLVLPDSKTGDKMVPLSPQAVEYLRGLECGREAGVQWVCPNQRGNRCDNLQRVWRNVRGRAGLEDVRLHDLRRSAASDMAAAGLSLPMIGGVLGHQSEQTTAGYAYLMDNAQQHAARVMGDAIEQSTREGVERLRQQRAVGDDQGEAGGGDQGEAGGEVPIGGAKVIRFPGKRRE